MTDLHALTVFWDQQHHTGRDCSNVWSSINYFLLSVVLCEFESFGELLSQKLDQFLNNFSLPFPGI